MVDEDNQKDQTLFWQAISNYVPVCSSLSDHHCGTDNTCPRCGVEEETRKHMLFELMSSLVQAWSLLNISHSQGLFSCTQIYSNLDHLLWRATELKVLGSLLAFVPWIIWQVQLESSKRKKIQRKKNFPFGNYPDCIL